MSENVIILGAGASYDAGIPLLGNFIDKMIELSATGRGPRGPLSDTDKLILHDALQIRNTIEDYHARVTIDQFNLEQILSVLVFETQIGKKNSKQDLAKFTRAIATTIELTCNVLHDGNLQNIQDKENSIYKAFWLNFFNIYPNRLSEIPTILSFNYDLVLERSLLQSIIGYKHEEVWRKAKIDGLEIDFQNENSVTNRFKLKKQQFDNYVKRGDDCSFEIKPGYILDENYEQTTNFTKINLLKLHGSLNFSKDKVPVKSSLACSSNNAAIIPPVFNKSDSSFASPIWKTALESLRNCRNLIICGYSLPTSDTYMQYFLKAALGPNRVLNKIFVFDPSLYKDGDNGVNLRKRYSECFSTQFQNRIEFQPTGKKHPKIENGTFAHMVSMFGADPDHLLFGLKPYEKKKIKTFLLNMDPTVASEAFISIVGLICNWKQERGSQAADRYQDFMTWLVQHNFNDLNERIFASEELQRDLSALLSQDLSVISTKLDTIAGSLSAVADKIDSLSQISRTLGAGTEALSEQAARILKIFDQLEANRMIYSTSFHQCIFDFKPISFQAKRFVLPDIQALEQLNFIRHVDHTQGGDPIYVITRQGSKFAEQLPQITI